MIEGFYDLLAKVGFTHPLHPILVHVPMGMVIGGVAFSLANLIWKNKHFDQSAYHCILLALIAIVPVYSAGLMDWQHVYGGEWSKWIIIKMILGAVLTCTLAFAVWQKHSGAPQRKLLLIYLGALALCGGLGYCGGEILYGG